MSGELIMVVDDDRDIRESLADVLQDEGYQVVGASNGQDALDQLQRGTKPKVILLDLMMPVMDGHAFYERWRADAQLKAIPLFVITAGRATHEALAEANGLLQKPLDLEQLLGILKKHAGA